MRGKGNLLMTYSRQVKDHPRLCGEKLIPAAFAHCFQGSPPPMRGKENEELYDMYHGRITPAYAGKSRGRSSENNFDWDHPRLCGEKSHGSMMRLKWRGSPPPMRGKAVWGTLQTRDIGITPAYAGKSMV